MSERLKEGSPKLSGKLDTLNAHLEDIVLDSSIDRIRKTLRDNMTCWSSGMRDHFLNCLASLVNANLFNRRLLESWTDEFMQMEHSEVSKFFTSSINYADDLVDLTAAALYAYVMTEYPDLIASKDVKENFKSIRTGLSGVMGEMSSNTDQFAQGINSQFGAGDRSKEALTILLLEVGAFELGPDGRLYVFGEVPEKREFPKLPIDEPEPAAISEAQINSFLEGNQSRKFEMPESTPVVGRFRRWVAAGAMAAVGLFAVMKGGPEQAPDLEPTPDRVDFVYSVDDSSDSSDVAGPPQVFDASETKPRPAETMNVLDLDDGEVSVQAKNVWGMAAELSLDLDLSVESIQNTILSGLWIHADLDASAESVIASLGSGFSQVKHDFESTEDIETLSDLHLWASVQYPNSGVAELILGNAAWNGFVNDSSVDLLAKAHEVAQTTYFQEQAEEDYKRVARVKAEVEASGGNFYEVNYVSDSMADLPDLSDELIPDEDDIDLTDYLLESKPVEVIFHGAAEVPDVTHLLEEEPEEEPFQKWLEAGLKERKVTASSNYVSPQLPSPSLWTRTKSMLSRAGSWFMS